MSVIQPVNNSAFTSVKHSVTRLVRPLPSVDMIRSVCLSVTGDVNLTGNVHGNEHVVIHFHARQLLAIPVGVYF